MRLHKISLIVMLFVSVLGSSGLAANNEEAIRAALFGPEKKKVKILDPKEKKWHEFNVKPVSYGRDSAGLFVFGQLSHHLTGQGDDQLWYCIVKRRGQTAGARLITIKPSRLRKVMEKVKIIQKIPIKDPRWLVAVKALGAASDVINRGSGWERAAESFYQQLAEEVDRLPSVQVRSGVELFQHSNNKGKKITISNRMNVANLKKYRMNDEISSLVANVPSGYELELFKDANYKGDKMTLGSGTHAIRDLKTHGLGDEFSSLRWTVLK